MHLAESRCIPQVNIEVMQKLGENFVASFPNLYTNRHCVQVVHSVVHVPTTVRHFGPLTNYTTFNFENCLGQFSFERFSSENVYLCLGLFTNSCKSTRRHAKEMISNLHLLQSAHQQLTDLTLDHSFKNELLSIIHRQQFTEKIRIKPSRTIIKRNPLVESLFPGKKLSYFNRLHINNLLLSTVSGATSKDSDDSTVVFQASGEARMGRINSIFKLDENDNVLLLIDLPTEIEFFTCDIDHNSRFRHCSVQVGRKANETSRLVQPSDIIEKCVYYEEPDGKCHFMRFPNLVHSS